MNKLKDMSWSDVRDFLMRYRNAAPFAFAFLALVPIVGFVAAAILTVFAAPMIGVAILVHPRRANSLGALLKALAWYVGIAVVIALASHTFGIYRGNPIVLIVEAIVAGVAFFVLIYAYSQPA